MSDQLPTSPSKLTFDATDRGTLTHRLFRYPAKFHSPVASALVERFSLPGQTVLDPFCGSGTVMVEASVRNRRSIGSDIDPLAVAVSVAKTRTLDTAGVAAATKRLREDLLTLERSEQDYQHLAHNDMATTEMTTSLADLWIPKIPRMEHWFRRYVIVDLAQILAAIDNVDCSPDIHHWLRVVFASIIRNASNADPVPVSGLEVTAHMKRLDAAGRVINPFALFKRALTKAEAAAVDYATARSEGLPDPAALLADATTLTLDTQVDAIVTSPPYQNAVDYYRRHQLEMFWLGLTESQQDRLELLPKYIGKHRIAQSNPIFEHEWEPPANAQRWLDLMADSSEGRARDFRAYMMAMDMVFRRWASMLGPGAHAVCVVGRSTWKGADIPTERLFVELTTDRFKVTEHLSYPVRNRYMSYTRHNGANINEEHVLVLTRI